MGKTIPIQGITPQTSREKKEKSFAKKTLPLNPDNFSESDELYDGEAEHNVAEACAHSANMQAE